VTVEFVDDAIHIEPSAEMRAALSREIESFGESIRGDYYLSWEDDRPSGPCICIMQRNLRGKESCCVEIRGADEKPRQINLDDIYDFKRQLHRRLTKKDWVAEHYAAKEEAEKKHKADRRDRAEQTVKELIRVVTKAPVTFDLGNLKPAPDAPPEGGYRVIDRRVRHEV
jgi:hypothetical protein